MLYRNKCFYLTAKTKTKKKKKKKKKKRGQGILTEKCTILTYTRLTYVSLAQNYSSAFLCPVPATASYVAT